MNNKKVSKVMHEFKTGSLKSSSGQKVTNPKQGIAIALSEARRDKKGGEMKESKSMEKMSMKRGGASMAKAKTPGGRSVLSALGRMPMSAKAKAMMPGPVMPAMQPGMKKGGPAKKYAEGGAVRASKMGSVLSGGNKPHGEHTVQKSGHTKAKQITMPGNKNMRKGGKV
jgi:hypothetical protein